VVAGHVVEFDSVVVEVVKDSQTSLVALSVVRLGTAGSSGIRPFVCGGGSTRRPGDGGVSAVIHVTSGPEVLLVFSGNQTCELVLLGRGIKTDRPHALASAESSTLA